MGVFPLVARVGCLRGGAIRLLEEWPHIPLRREDRTRLTDPLALYLPVADGRSSTANHRARTSIAAAAAGATGSWANGSSADPSRQTRSKAVTIAALAAHSTAKRRQARRRDAANLCSACTALATRATNASSGPRAGDANKAAILSSSVISCLQCLDEGGAGPRHDRFQGAERQRHDRGRLGVAAAFAEA